MNRNEIKRRKIIVLFVISWAIYILSLVFWCAKNEREISDLRIELKKMQFEEMKEYIEQLKKERRELDKLPVVNGN